MASTNSRDCIAQFHSDVRAFAAAARRAAPGGAAAPPVPSCPGWSVSDLVVHLASVHRYVARLLRERLTEQPDHSDLSFLLLPADTDGWPHPDNAPNHAPLPETLLDWFMDGAAALEELFRSSAPDEPVWSWAPDRTAGFWMRIQAIEAAVHRWDAENATGTALPVAPALAADAVGQNFRVMAPFRRALRQAPPGSGECFRFRRTDGPDVWTVRFDGDTVRLGELGEEDGGPCDVELTGTASDLMLFLWQRIPAGQLAGVTGDRDVLDRWFTLVPPV